MTIFDSLNSNVVAAIFILIVIASGLANAYRKQFGKSVFGASLGIGSGLMLLYFFTAATPKPKEYYNGFSRPQGCSADLNATVGYYKYLGPYRVGSGKRASTAHLRIPNAIRNPVHYDENCLPRPMPPANGWIQPVDLDISHAIPMTFAVSATGAAPFPIGQMPQLMPPGLPMPKGSALAILHDHTSLGRADNDVTTKLSQQVTATPTALAANHQASFGMLRAEALDGANGSGQLKSNVYIECDQTSFCRMFAPILYRVPVHLQNRSITGPLSGTVLEIWINKADEPNAKQILIHVEDYLRNATTEFLPAD